MSDLKDIPTSLIAPVRLGREAIETACGLLFPHGKHLPVGLVVGWEGITHLIYLEGEFAFREAPIDVGSSIRGLVINDLVYQVDLTSAYNALNEYDPDGALVMQGGRLFLACRRLGDPFNNDSRLVPLGQDCPPGGAEESCGFTRWSIGVPIEGKVRVLRSFGS